MSLKPVHLFSIDGNRQWLDGGAMYGNAPKAVWSKWSPPDDKNRIALSCRCLLAEIGGQKVLCETGIGAFFEPRLAERFGIENSSQHVLLENLKKLQIEPDQIDFVILSHLHFDHAGGLLPTYKDTQRVGHHLVFPKAKFLVSKEALARATDPHPRDKASFIPELTQLLLDSGRLIIVNSETVSGFFDKQISFKLSHGHTPGQMHTMLTGPNASIVFAGDLVPGTTWVHAPITMGYDRNPEMLINEKLELYADVTRNKRWLFYTHDTEYCASQISKSESGKFEPLNSIRAFNGTII